MTLNQLLWKLTKEKFTLHEVNFGGAAKISSLLSIMLHITPWTLMLMLHIRQSIYLVLTNILSASFLMFHITFDEISTTLYNSGKDRCTRYMWSNDMFVLWNRISAIFYEDRKHCLHIFPWFLTSWTFRITSLPNNQSLGFHGFVMFSFSPSNAKDTFTKDAGQKMFISWHDWK